MKKIRFGDIVRILAIIFFLGVLLYPTISSYLAQKNSSRVIDTYDENLAKLNEEEKEKMLKEANEYNASLSHDQYWSDPFETQDDEEENTLYSQVLNAGLNGMMGYIKIPKIDIEIPIYHSTKESVLQKGIGHYEVSSLPVGGLGTHTVLTGHRGLPNAKLFTDLDELVIGDIFYIKVLDETLAYQVDQILTVEPSDTEALAIVDNMDYATLVTCTPYAVNTHRLLVRGHRIPYEEAIEIVADEVDGGIHIPFEIQLLLISFISLAIIITIIRKRR